jgi:hypothetical protein
MDIDRQLIAAVRALEKLGYGYSHRTGDWLPPAAPPLPLTAEADAMHGALNAAGGCTRRLPGGFGRGDGA